MITDSRQDARAERQASRGPYTPRSANQVKRSTSMLGLPGIKSIMSIFGLSRSSSFRGLPLTNDDIAADQKSESGSEDHFSGSPPAEMRGQDINTVARAAGREGEAFETRAATWRAKGEKPGGRRELSRRNHQDDVEAGPKSPHMPGHLAHTFRVSPSMPQLRVAGPLTANGVSVSTSKARQQPTKTALPDSVPKTPYAPSAITDPSPSSVAIKAIIDAKHGQNLTNEDMRVIATLSQTALHAEPATPRRTPTPEPREQYGGWAAGSFTPRTIKAFSPIADRDTRSGFSIGASPVPASSRLADSTTYHGVGYGTRRLKSKRTGLKPLLLVDSEASDIEGSSLQKRHLATDVSSFRQRRTLDETTDSGDMPLSPLNSSHSMPVLASSAKRLTRSSAGLAPPTDAVSRGKKRAADMISDLVASEASEYIDDKPFVVNPYHPDARTVVATFKPAPIAPGTPGKSVPRPSGSKTPLRGAAKRLDEAQPPAVKKRRGSFPSKYEHSEAGSTTQDDVELDGRHPATPATKKITVSELVAQQTPTTTSAASSQHNRATPRIPTARFEEPAPVQPFTAPQLSSGDLPDSTASSSGVFQFGSSGPNASPSSALFDFTAPSAPAQSTPFQFGAGSSAPSANGNSIFGAHPPTGPAQPPFSAGSAPLPSAGNTGSANPLGGNMFGIAQAPPTPASGFGGSPSMFSSSGPSVSYPGGKLFGQATPVSNLASAPNSPFTSVTGPFPIGTAPLAPSPMLDTRKPGATRQNIFHSPRSTARSLADEATPFYTFSGGIDMITTPEMTQRARVDALDQPIPKFEYTITPPDDSQYKPGKHGQPFWLCEGCRQLNAAMLSECHHCHQSMPKTMGHLDPSLTKTVWSAKAVELGYTTRGREAWACSACSYRNSGSKQDRSHCGVCGAPRTDESARKAERVSSSKGRTGISKAARALRDTPYGRSSETVSTQGPEVTSAAAGPSHPIKPFNWVAAGKPDNTWICDTCSLVNPDSATDKCTICEADRPKTASASAPTATGGFDWAAAGGKKTTDESSAAWTCRTCMLQNPASATDKCTICEADRPDSVGTSAPTSASAPPLAKTAPGGFDWAAAGGKKPTSGQSNAAWTCGTCMLQNPASATEKCTVCEEPRTG